MLDQLKDFVSTRGVQLLSRYLGQGLSTAAVYLHVTGDPATVHTSASFLATLIGAGVCAALDHYSHTQQATIPLSEVVTNE